MLNSMLDFRFDMQNLFLTFYDCDFNDISTMITSKTLNQ